VTTRENSIHRGTLRGERWLQLIAREFRDARLARGLSQRLVAAAVAIPRSTYSDIEHANYRQMSIVLAARLGAALGIDVVVGLYPGPRALRDEGSARLISRLVSAAGPPLQCRTEVILARIGDQSEQRSWDVLATGHGKRSAFEIEMRLYDAQAQTRRINLKRADDPVDSFLLVIADTKHNRRVLFEFPELFADLPRLRTATVLKMLKAGQHPPTGHMLL
jgi:transcriptional regulator with XRE-family HTH domain